MCVFIMTTPLYYGDYRPSYFKHILQTVLHHTNENNKMLQNIEKKQYQQYVDVAEKTGQDGCRVLKTVYSHNQKVSPLGASAPSCFILSFFILITKRLSSKTLSVILNQNIAIYLQKKYKLAMITGANTRTVVLVHVKVDSGDDKLDHLIGIVYFPSIKIEQKKNNEIH